LKVPETVLSIAGFNLSVRQFFVLLIGLAIAYQLWSALSLFASMAIFAVGRWIVAALPLLVALAVAFVRLSGRTLDLWLPVLLRYALRPRQLVWRSIRFVEPWSMIGLVEEEESTR
jgi:hypothetical protein